MPSQTPSASARRLLRQNRLLRNPDQSPALGPPAGAQENANTAVRPAVPTINYRERPRYPYDPQRLKRRPILDGRIADNEWDPLYTITDTAAKGTVYVNWDDDFLYVGAKVDQPSWIVFDLDCNAIDPRGRNGFIERYLHGEILRARPDVVAVAHSHSPSVIAFGLSTKIHGHTTTARMEAINPPFLKSICFGNRLAMS